ncbi:probable galacturonosyltransferase 7 isoform X1 [Zingiber officinale]|uniref:probable galacturonosyltransferase 7 isoform X1 n=1 Tax=Zingiber officinale TaxID=94328 RepID=UPI001C4C1854|nr:probable galacturonosyltransferase 7 isoform X1 [Zingiber officinale]
MKGFVTISTSSPAKRRWRPPAAVVLVLVFFSLLVPLDFLFGLHRRFPAGYSSDDRPPSEIAFRHLGHLDGFNTFPQGETSKIKKLVRRFGSSLSKNASGNPRSKQGEIFNNKPINNSNQQLAVVGKVLPVPSDSLPISIMELGGTDGKKSNTKDQKVEEVRNFCQLELGSYCLWSIENKKVMKDSMVRKLKDQLFVARAYYPSLVKLHGQQNLSYDLKQNIQEHEHMLSDTIIDADLPRSVKKNIHKMKLTIAKVKACAVDCNNVHKKLSQIVDLTEDEANFHMKQSAFLYHLGVQTMPKSFHCLSMRLTVESFKLSTGFKNSHSNKLEVPKVMHYVIFSKNMIAAAVTINSTVMNSEVNQNMVFHVVTDAQNYYAMKLWFARNSYRDAEIIVINLEQLNLGDHNSGLSKLSFSEEFRVSLYKTSQLEMNTEYITTFGHSHFLLPEIFKNLKKVIVLDDDVVVQRDLSSLWNLNLEGKVNAAVESCRLRLGQLKMHLGKNSYDPNSCIWMSGLNVIDLEKWREHNVTDAYFQHLTSIETKNEATLRAAVLPISFLVFQNLVYPLDEKWSFPGLGHNYDINADAMNNAISLHYNGYMKPWLDLGIPKYKEYWKKFLTNDERFMDECNVNL